MHTRLWLKTISAREVRKKSLHCPGKCVINKVRSCLLITIIFLKKMDELHTFGKVLACPPPVPGEEKARAAYRK